MTMVRTRPGRLSRLDPILTTFAKGMGRSHAPLPFNDWVSMFGFGTFPRFSNSLEMGREEVEQTFEGLANGAYRGNSIVFACEQARYLLFGEVKFQYQQMRNGLPAELFGSPDLALIDKPEPGMTTRGLLMRAMLDADTGGQAVLVRRGGPTIKRLRPDWVTLVHGHRTLADVDMWDPDVQFLGILYHPGGRLSGRDPIAIPREEVGLYRTAEHPTSQWLGWPWMVAALQEIIGDNLMTEHKARFLEKGASPALIVNLSEPDPAKWREWVSAFRQEHEGAVNAYKTLFLNPATTAQVVGANLRQMDFKAVQGAAETRIAAAAKVPPIVVGLSEGLQAATYSNYGQARRAFADGTMRPLWGGMAEALETLVTVPRPGVRLWYYDGHVAFLQEDRKDEADVKAQEATIIRTLTDGGYDPMTVIAAVKSGDWGQLDHTGLLSVQMQPPGSDQPARATYTPAASVAKDEPEETEKRRMIAAASRRLIDAGRRPTDAAVAEELGLSDRTVRRWRQPS